MKNFHRKLISLLEIIGGILGIGVILFSFFTVIIPYFQSDAVTLYKIITSMIFLYAFLVYCFSTLSGLLLWKKHKKAVQLSLISQSVQIPTFLIPGMTYMLVSCFGVFVKISLSSLFFSAYFGSRFSIFFLPQSGNYYIGLNIVALVIFIFLYKHRKEVV